MKHLLRLLALPLVTCLLSLCTSPALRAQGLVSTLEVQKSVKFGTLAIGTITPTQLTADTDDWAPTGFSTAFALRVSTDSSHNLGGIAGGAAGRVITLENIGSFSLVLKNAGSGSTAANRFALTRDYILEAGSGVFLKYDATASRWCILGAQPAPGSSATVTNTGGNLTSNSLVLGAGTVDTKVVAGLTTDGTSKIVLGVAGTSVGGIDFKNATSGTVTVHPPTGALSTADGTLPLGTFTFATLAGAETLTSKTFGSGTAVSSSISFTAGVKQTFAPNTTTSGLNAGSFAGVPSSLVNGDIFYDSTANALKAQINGATVALGAGSGTPGGSTTQVQFNSAGAFTGSANFTYASSVLGLINGLSANTSGDGFTVSNTTTASSGNQSFSPRIVLDGQGWKTTSTAASQDVRFAIETRPVQGTTNPTGNFVVSSNVNAAGYSDRFTIDNSGAAYLGSTTAGKMSSTSGSFDILAQGTNQNVTLTPSGTGFTLVNGFTGFGTTTPAQTIHVKDTASGANKRILIENSNAAGFAVLNLKSDSRVWQFATGGSSTGDANKFYLYDETASFERITVDQNGQFKITATTSATNTTSGSLLNSGGFGNAGALWNGGLLNVAGDLQLSKTITGSGTTGAQTINKTSGSVRFAAAASSLVVTNSLVATTSVIICTVGSNDATCKSVQAVAASGSFTIFPNANPTAETIVYFHVTN